MARDLCEVFEDSLAPLADAILTVKDDDSAIEEDDAPDELWKMVVYLPNEEALTEARRLIAAAATTLGLTGVPDSDVEPIPLEDWAARSAEGFQPIRVGRFYLHPSHATPPVDERWPLQIDAGAAFGSGEHETTSTCLLALDALAADGVAPGRVLDMGTGSGILAVAAAMLWPAPVTAADNDPIAVEVAAATAAINGVGDRITALVSDGFAAPGIAASAPYDLITANILAGPLVVMAPDLAANLAPGGHAVLSGLLRTQVAGVLSPHQAAGLRLIRRFPMGDWVTLVLTRDAEDLEQGS
ncbi:MAG: methyltransferase [Alphaproteobacteria bacterium]|nr:methyltransferase [Alphaproteobacteria bacterium]